MLPTSTRALGWTWLGALALFALSVWGATATLPANPPTRPGASYWIGLVGLLAVGGAIALTWKWSGDHPIPAPALVALRLVLVLLALLWMIAMLFPFL